MGAASGRTILLVRHGAVDPRYRGVCYGQSDIALSPEGEQQSLRAAEALANCPITHVFHSGLARAQFLAWRIAQQAGVAAQCDPRLMERQFGAWELRPWQAIYAESGNAMDGLITAPYTYAPPGGETTSQLAARVLAWHRDLPPQGCIVAVSHGGPIAALVGSLRGLPVERWLELVPDYACSITLRDP